MIVYAVFGLSVLVACIYSSLWGDISPLTAFVILLSLLSFSSGGALASFNQKPVTRTFHVLQIPWFYTAIVIVFMAVITIRDYADVSAVAGESGLSILAVVALARENMYIEDVSIEHSTFVLQGLYASRAFFYIYIYIIFYRLLLIRKPVNILYWVPIVLYFMQCLLSTGRTDFIYLVYAIMLVVYINLKTRKGWIKRHEEAYMKYLLIGFVLFMGFFLFLSLNRHEGDVDLNQVFGVYVGSPIYAYDWYLNKYGVDATANYFGEYTQWLYYSITNALHLTNKTCESVLPPVYLSGIMTNIYTCLYRYTHDYGIYIMFVIIFLLGFAYTKLFYLVVNNPSRGRLIVLYSFLSYPLVEFAIEERFLSVLISARSFYCVVYILLFYRLIVQKGKLSCVSC